MGTESPKNQGSRKLRQDVCVGGMSKVRSWTPLSGRVSSKLVDKMVVENTVTETLGEGMRSLAIATYWQQIEHC